MSDPDDSADKARSHRTYARAVSRAADYLKAPEKLNELLFRAQVKTRESGTRLRELGADLQAVFRLLKSWATGRYKAIPWNSLLLIVASLIYFLMPLDSLPDFIPFWGLFDDAALLAWTLRQVRKDLDAYLAWEVSQQVENMVDQPPPAHPDSQD